MNIYLPISLSQNEVDALSYSIHPETKDASEREINNLLLETVSQQIRRLLRNYNRVSMKLNVLGKEMLVTPEEREAIAYLDDPAGFAAREVPASEEHVRKFVREWFFWD